jgi:hypothetical protein
MRVMHFWAALVLMSVCAQPALAQGTITWDSGYPTGGTNPGEISVSGNISLDCGWYIGGAGCETPNPEPVPGYVVTIRVWQDGTVVFEFVGSAMGATGGPFSGTATGLIGGTSYNVTVEVGVSNCLDLETIKTAPGTATATTGCFGPECPVAGEHCFIGNSQHPMVRPLGTRGPRDNDPSPHRYYLRR